MHILGTLPETRFGKQQFIVWTDLYTKLLTRVITVSTVTLTKAVTVFVDTWVILYGF